MDEGDGLLQAFWLISLVYTFTAFDAARRFFHNLKGVL